MEGLFFSTFFGGSDETWASKDDVFVDFKNFIVSE
ncbi:MULTISPECIES: polysaccharide lyase [Bacteria]